MASWGASAETIAEWTRAPVGREPWGLLADQVPAFELFLACDSQWRFATHVPAGLDYNAVYRVAETMAIAITPERLGELRVLEAAAVRALAKR